MNNFYCCACANLVNENNLLNNENVLSIEQQLIDCFNINIFSNNIPKNVCNLCSNKIATTYEFKQQIEKAQATLKIVFSKHVETKFRTDSHNELEINNCSIFDSCTGSDTDNKSLPIISDNFNKTNDSRLLKSLRLRRKCASKDSENKVKIKNEERSRIIRQVIKEWKTYEWRCFLCNTRTFTNVEDLRCHYKLVHDNVEPRYTCNECAKIISNYEAFKRHVRTHRIKYKFSCEFCNKYYFFKKHLDRHKYACHSKSANFICPECGKGFKTSTSLHIHGRSHLPQDVKYQFECNVCQKKFTTKQSLNWHKKIHAGIKEYTCDQCGKSFAQKGNLESHIFSHTNATPFSCDQCIKTFKTSVRLKRHLIIHSGEKPYECKICGATFRQKWTLNRHAKVHTTELPFECEYCRKCFRLKAFLKIHLRQHTGERPYSCVECNHHFANSSNYIKHMRSRHGRNKTSQNQQTNSSIISQNDSMTDV